MDQTKTSAPTVGHEPSRPELIEQSVLEALAPLVRLLMQEGVSYPAFAKSLKNIFVEQAKAILQGQGQKLSDSALSLLSGVHRKDLRERHQSSPETKRLLSTLSEVYTTWANQPQFQDKNGQPLALTRSGEPGFDQLAASVTKDVHPGTLLNGLMQMGLVLEDQGRYSIKPNGFVPSGSLKDLLMLFSSNLADHMSAAAQNVRASQARFLEHSVFADEMPEESVLALHTLAAGLWRKSHDRFIQAANHELESNPQASAVPQRPLHRLRYGVYFYSEPMPGEEHNSIRGD